MRKIGIRARLFLSFTIVNSLIISVLSFLYYQQTSEVVWKNTIQVTHQALTVLSISLDQMFQEMDRISAQILYNPEIRQYFNNPIQLEDNDYDSLETRRRLEDILVSFNGPSFTVNQINVFNLQGDIISAGTFFPFADNFKKQLDNNPQIKNSWPMNGVRHINPPHLSKWYRNQKFIFSLTRSIPIPMGQSPTLIEVEQSHTKLKDKVAKVLLTNANVYIYDEEGHLFFPVNQTETAPSPLPFNRNLLTRTGTSGIMDAQDKENFISVLQGSYSNLYIAFVQPTALFLDPIKNLQKTTLFVILIVEAISILLSYWIASALSSPVRHLTRMVKKMDYSNLNLPVLMESKRMSGELLDLRNAFITMKSRLNESITNALESQKRENIAYFQALQAQLNPHFLYNTLYSMGTLAEESGTPVFAEMCYKLISMMRYITLPATEASTIEQEINHTQAYLELMKLRYESDLSYRIEVAPHLSHLSLPKLTIQPIVENSFKHAFRSVLPPWELYVMIQADSVDSTGWHILISDNGRGFDPEVLAQLEEMIVQLQRGQFGVTAPPLKKSVDRGFGLMNTLARNKLFFGNRVTFTIKNLSLGMSIDIYIRNEREVPQNV